MCLQKSFKQLIIFLSTSFSFLCEENETPLTFPENFGAFLSSSQIQSEKVQTEADELTHVNRCHLSLRLICSVMEWMKTAKLQSLTTRDVSMLQLFSLWYFFIKKMMFLKKKFYNKGSLKERILQLGL